jgi:hypothetical protein
MSKGKRIQLIKITQNFSQKELIKIKLNIFNLIYLFIFFFLFFYFEEKKN